MSKNKKILISLAIIIALSIVGYFIYQYINQPDYVSVEQAGLNNISGVIESVEKNKLGVLAQVPDEFTPFSKGGYMYVNKRYVLETTSETEILLHIKDNEFNLLTDLATVKPNDAFSAISKQNIMNNNELEVVELIIYKLR